MRIDEITRRDFIGGMAGAALMPGAALANDKPKMDPFNKEDQDFIFNWVANKMKIKVNPGIRRPLVVDINQIDKNVFKETWGFLPDGDAHTFHWIRNWVIISRTAKSPAASLVHEYTHYFQFEYIVNRNIKDMDWDGISEDRYEIQALDLQRLFQKEILDKPNN